MSDPTAPEAVGWRLMEHGRRIDHLEKLELDVLVNRVYYLEKKVDAMTRALWTTAGSLVLAAVTFALAAGSGMIR